MGCSRAPPFGKPVSSFSLAVVILLLFLDYAIPVWHVKPCSCDTSLSRLRLLRGAVRSLVFVSASRWFAISRPVACLSTLYISPNLSETSAETITRLSPQPLLLLAEPPLELLPFSLEKFSELAPSLAPCLCPSFARTSRRDN